VVADFEAEPFGHRLLALFDPAIHELFDLAAVHTHDMVVMTALVEFEHRHAALEVVARHETGRLELSQHAVHGGEADIFVGYQELLVDVLGAHVAR